MISQTIDTVLMVIECLPAAVTLGEETHRIGSGNGTSAKNTLQHR